MTSWIRSVYKPHLYWHHFTTNFNPLDPKNPVVNITLHNLKDRPDFKNLDVIIETLFEEKLFQGKIINGNLFGKIDPNIVNHPGWRSRITIRILNFQTFDVGTMIKDDNEVT